MVDEPKSCLCGICRKPTRMTGTKRCDACWELESRLRNEKHAQQVLRHVSKSWIVGVLPEEGCGMEGDDDFVGETFYEIFAASAMDARVIAFIMDGGMPSRQKTFKEGEISLVETYTRIVK